MKTTANVSALPPSSSDHGFSNTTYYIDDTLPPPPSYDVCSLKRLEDQHVILILTNCVLIMLLIVVSLVYYGRKKKRQHGDKSHDYEMMPLEISHVTSTSDGSLLSLTSTRGKSRGKPQMGNNIKKHLDFQSTSTISVISDKSNTTDHSMLNEDLYEEDM